MNYTIYRIDGGKIEKTVICPEDALALQFDSATHGYLDGGFSDAAFYIEAGQPVAMPTKPSEHHIFNYATKQWIDPRTPDTEWPLVRDKRDRLLQTSDWTDTASAPARLGQELYEQWQVYRQALRDVTEQPDPFNIVWPELP